MIEVSDEQFTELIDKAFDRLPQPHRDNIRNVALLHSDEPTPEQRIQLELRNDQTLLGLYEGVPLSKRQGTDTTLPDKITLFKLPLCAMVDTVDQLQQEIYHTLWHEVAHYYGLDHEQIYSLE